MANDEQIDEKIEEENSTIDDLADSLSHGDIGTTKAPSRSWSYGIFDLKVEGEKDLSQVDDQYRRMQEYQDALVFLEIEHRKAFREKRALHSLEIGEIDEKISTLKKSLEEERKKGKKVRQKTKMRTEFPSDVKMKIAALNAELKALRTKKKEIKEALENDYIALLKVRCPEILTIEAEIEKLGNDKKFLGKKENTGEVKDRLREIRIRLKYLKGRRIFLFEGLGEDAERITKWKIERDMAVIEKDIIKRGRDARIRINPYWGNYLFVNAVLKVMRADKIDPVNPKKKGWDGSGRIGVVMRPSISCGALFGQKSRLLQITPLSSEAPYLPKRCDRNKANLTSGRIRVNSTEDGDPIWLTFKFHMHRELPSDSIIKSAWIVKERVGFEFRYKLQISLGSKNFSKEKPGTGTCAIGLGWRCRNGRPLRVAYLVDDSGHEEEICLDPAIQEKFDHVASLRSIRDKNFDKIRPQVVAFLANPEISKCWLHSQFKNLVHWKNIRRFADITEIWAEERVHGDEQIFPKVWEFCVQDNHLYTWEANEREKALAARKDDYRNVAARVSTAYAKVRIEEIDLSSLARLANPEADKEALHQISRHNRVQAAPSEFRQVLISACQARGTVVENLPCPYSTVLCHVCGEINEWDKAAHLEHTCVKCGTIWDQDKNASVNFLRAENVKQGKKGKKSTCDFVTASDYTKKDERTAEVGLYFEPLNRTKAGYVRIGPMKRDIMITPDVVRLCNQADSINEIRRENFRMIKTRIDQERLVLSSKNFSESLGWALNTSPTRLCRFFQKRWTEERVLGDESLYSAVREWMTEEVMNREREVALRREAGERRREIYLKVVNELTGVTHVMFLAIGAGGIPRKLDASPTQLHGIIEDFLKQQRVGYSADRRKHYESARARLLDAVDKAG